MFRIPSLTALGLLVIAAAASAATPPKAGTYELAVMPTSSGETVYAIVKIVPKDDGTVTGDVVATSPRIPNFSIEKVAIDGDLLRITAKVGNGTPTFEAKLPAKGDDTILGSFGDDARIMPAKLTLTTKEKLEASDVTRRNPMPSPMEAVQKLNSKVLIASVKASRARTQLRQAQDDDEKVKLRKEILDAQAEVQQAQSEFNKEAPKLYREVIEKHADHPAAADAALALLQRAKTTKLSADEVAKLGQLIMKRAEVFGARYQADRASQLAEMLAPQKDYSAVAVGFARLAEKGLNEKSTMEKQSRVLHALATSLRASGNSAEADAVDARVAKIESELDKQYFAKVPPFKPESFEGRKSKSDRVVLMELFTGAQCPPCVAADVAFDALEKTYKPTEVALLQYHLHIPGPDPLTNSITEARAKHYGANSTPTTLFNGKKEASGGGAMANAEKKYKQYREIIEKQIEEPAKANLSVEANRTGDTINIRAKVKDLDDPSEKKRLRFALVEESVRYTGGNGLRFHHMVVRDMPGGPDGFALTKKDNEHTASVKLDTLRQALTKYLDEAGEKRAFPKPDRPMALKHLKVVAFVQDGDNGEILQAAVADLGGEHAAK